MNYRRVLIAVALGSIALGTASAQQGDKKAPAATQQAKPAPAAKADTTKKDAKMEGKKEGTKKGMKKGMKKDAMKKDSTKAATKKP